MGRFYSYLNSANSILNAYKGEQPFNIFLKSFFSQHKKFGSRDRREITHLCYCFFRIGHALQECPIDERMLAALFLCEQQPGELLSALKPEWSELISLPVEEKSSVLSIKPDDIFPWTSEISDGIEFEPFAVSFLTQPDLYIRIRPQQDDNVKDKLRTSGIAFNEITHSCLRLNNATQLDKAINLDKEAVVQDYNSQRVGEFFDQAQTVLSNANTPMRVYDCCAASGGKSILAYDVLTNIDLTVSDIRESILSNLKKRFQKAGIRNYSAFVQDLSAADPKPQVATQEKFDLVICDVPCSGSGTWSRTPEQLYYFKKDKIDYYSGLQKNILESVIPLIRNDGCLLYITCSVFKKENEEQLKFIQDNFPLKLIRMELLKGYDKKADTMFAALFQRSDVSKRSDL